jgi:hypothetical protein
MLQERERRLPQHSLQGAGRPRRGPNMAHQDLYNAFVEVRGSILLGLLHHQQKGLSGKPPGPSGQGALQATPQGQCQPADGSGKGLGSGLRRSRNDGILRSSSSGLGSVISRTFRSIPYGYQSPPHQLERLFPAQERGDKCSHGTKCRARRCTEGSKHSCVQSGQGLEKSDTLPLC